MIYTTEEIKNKAIPLAKEYGLDSLGIFGSYARGEATDNSDIDFIMDDGEIDSLLNYISLVRELEETFHCHVDLISVKGADKDFISSVQKEEVLIYERER